MADIDPVLRHLVERVTYGYNHATFAMLTAMGAETYLQNQLAPDTIDDSVVDSLLTTYFPTLNYSNLEMLALLQEPGEGVKTALELQVAKLIRQVYSQRQLYELMVDFWTNHFNIYQAESPLFAFKTIDEREVIRPHAMGSFKSLLHASAKSPAMLFYLDNKDNRVDGLNENYARELMELHTLGVDGGYTENDVVETARCLTGWTIYPGNGEFLFRARWHDNEPKQVMDYQTGSNGGISDGEGLLDYLATHPSTAHFICKKLCTYFISDTPDSAVVEATADTFLQTEGDITAVLITLFMHDAFWQSAGQKFKRPQRYLSSCLRLLNATPSEQGWGFLLKTLGDLGHVPYHWPAPNGYPITAGYWLNNNAMLQRWNLASVIVQAPTSATGIDWAAAQIEGVEADELVRLVKNVLSYPLSDSEQNAVVATVRELFGTRPLTAEMAEAAARHIVYLMLAHTSFQNH